MKKRAGLIGTKIANSSYYDESGKVQLIPKENLPVRLPEKIDLKAKGNPLDSKKDWKTIINHEQANPRNQTSHAVKVIYNTKLHKIIKDQMPPPRKGLLGAYKEIIPTMFKQAKDPNFKIELSIPQKI